MTPPRKPRLDDVPLPGKARRLASWFRQKVTSKKRSVPHNSAAELLDLFAPEVAYNPFPQYERLRREGPVHFLPRHGYWLLIGYDVVNSALSQPQLFSNRVREWTDVDSVLLGADPPEHTAVRRVVGQHFSSQDLEMQTAFAEKTAASLLQPLLAGGRLNVLGEFATPLSEEVAAHLIGIDRPTLSAMRAAQATATDLAKWLTELDAIVAAAADRLPLYEQLLRDGDGELSHADVRSLIRFLWIAGTTTTRRTIASSVLMLLRHPAMRSHIEADPASLSTFVEESLRFCPPEHTIARRAATDIEISGAKIPANALVKLCIAAANRDPTQFADPETFLLHRTPNRHLSFGFGVHRCIGAPLARVEMAAAVRVLLRLAPGFRSVEPLQTLRFVGFVNDSEELVIEAK